MQIGSDVSEMLGRFLDVTSNQMKLTASNLANVDTPGYKTLGLDFRQAMNDAMHAATDGESSGASGAGAFALNEVDGLVSRPDGNNVSTDREGIELAKEQLQFRTGVELLKREYSRTMSAIHADAK